MTRKLNLNIVTSKIVKRNYFKLGIILLTFAVMLLLSWLVKVVFKKQNNKKIIIHKVIKDKFEDNCDILNNIKNSLITDSINFTSSEHLVDNKRKFKKYNYNKNSNEEYDVTIVWDTNTSYFNNYDCIKKYSPFDSRQDKWCDGCAVFHSHPASGNLNLCHNNPYKCTYKCNNYCMNNNIFVRYYNTYLVESSGKCNNFKIDGPVNFAMFNNDVSLLGTNSILSIMSFSSGNFNYYYFEDDYDFIYYKDNVSESNNKYIIFQLTHVRGTHYNNQGDIYNDSKGIIEIWQFNPLLGRNSKEGNIHKLGYKLLEPAEKNYKINIGNFKNTYKKINNINEQDLKVASKSNYNLKYYDFNFNTKIIQSKNTGTSRNQITKLYKTIYMGYPNNFAIDYTQQFTEEKTKYYYYNLNNYSNILLKPLDFDLIENIPNTEIFKIIKEAIIPKISIPSNLEQIICNNIYNFSTNDKYIFLKYNNGKFKFIKLNLTKIDDNKINLIYKNWFYNGKGSININAGNVSLDTIKSSIENYINDNNISTLLNGSSSSSTTTSDIEIEEVEIQEIINENESIKLFSNILTLNNKIIVNGNSNKELIIDDKNIEIIGSSLLNFNMKFNFDVKFDMKYIIDSINETYQLNLNTNLLLKYKLVVKDDDIVNQIYETEIEEKQINKLDSTINNIEINLSEELKQYLFLFRDAKYELQIEINDNDNLIGKTIYITPTAINFQTYFEDKLPKYSSDKAFDELQVSKIV